MSEQDRIELLKGVSAYNQRSEPFPPTGNRLVTAKLEVLQGEGLLNIIWYGTGAFCWITDKGRKVLDAAV